MKPNSFLMLLQSPMGFEPMNSLPRSGSRFSHLRMGTVSHHHSSKFCIVDWIGFEPMVLPEWEQFYRLSASTACIPIQKFFPF